MVEINVFRHAADAVTLEPDDVLFKEGDDGDAMFAIIEGHVELIRNDVTLEVVGPGGILGELALIDPAPRSASAVAATTARVVRVDQDRFTFLVNEHPTFALQVMKVMADRLRRTKP